MKKLFTTTRGLSLVEVTIMLLVLMLLTGVLAPSIFDFVNDAKWVKVKEDCEAIGISVARLTRDVGACVKFDGQTKCTKANRVDLLYSDGPDVAPEDMGGDATTMFDHPGLATHLNWWKDEYRGDRMEDQFVINAPGYGTPASLGNFAAVGPQFNLGWRGAYLASPIGPDPWGHRYLVNTAFLAVAIDANAIASATYRPPTASYGWSNDVFCISAGPNALYETAFGGNGLGGVTRRHDDFIYVISGDTR
jgi:hypothetical protein